MIGPLVLIPDASYFSGVPQSTIRRWISEYRLERYGAHKPYRVDLYQVEHVRDTLKRPSRTRREH